MWRCGLLFSSVRSLSRLPHSERFFRAAGIGQGPQTSVVFILKGSCLPAVLQGTSAVKGASISFFHFNGTIFVAPHPARTKALGDREGTSYRIYRRQAWRMGGVGTSGWPAVVGMEQVCRLHEGLAEWEGHRLISAADGRACSTNKPCYAGTRKIELSPQWLRS